MVRERERNQAAATQPTANAAEHHPIGEFACRRRGCVNDGLVAVSAAQRLKPLRSMEYRATRVAVDKALPAPILQRVEFVNAHRFNR